jgi:WD40 repeat protein/esterase/lipase superfamily enzyme
MAKKRTAPAVPPEFKARGEFGEGGLIYDFAWSPDGQFLALSCDDGNIRIYKATGDLVQVIPCEGSVLVTEWSPDGLRLAVGDGEGYLYVIDPTSWKVKRRIRHDASVFALSWAKEGRMLACGCSDGYLAVYNDTDGGIVWEPPGHEDEVYACEWSPDSSLLWTCSYDGKVLQANIASKRSKAILVDDEDWPTCLAVCALPKGARLAIGYTDGTIRLRDTSKGRPRKLSGHSEALSSLSFSPSGRLLASKGDDDQVRLWRTDTWELVGSLPEPANGEYYAIAAFHPLKDDELATMGDKDRKLRLWSLDLADMLPDAVGAGESPPPPERPPSLTEPRPDASSTRPALFQADVLFLAANPPGTPMLQANRELEQVKLELSAGTNRLSLQSVETVIDDDLQYYLNAVQPRIVHFAGHGQPGGALLIHRKDGGTATIEPEDLARLLGDRAHIPECVFLNACFSLDLAETLLGGGVGCVVGMSGLIDDNTARTFAAGFYGDLGFAASYAAAFQSGLDRIKMKRLPDGEVPRLLPRAPAIIDVVPTRTARGAAAPLKQEARRIPLWFGTNRTPVDSKDITRGFTSQRGSELLRGCCAVVIPSSHTVGSLGSSYLWQLLTGPDSPRLDRRSLSVLPRDAFWTNLKTAVQGAAPGKRQAVVFIHGYRVSFEDAALHSAQIAADLGVPGVMAFYSWPSQGTYRGYIQDEAAIEGSERYLVQFLQELIQESGAEQVHLIAHSMGNRGLLRAMQRLRLLFPERAQPLFNQLILAAPDVDFDLFFDLAPQVYCPPTAKRVTLYRSSRDKALASSGILHGYSRAGYSPPTGTATDVDTVEVTLVDLSFFGHSGFSGARPVLTDMFYVLSDPERPINERATIYQPEGATYFALKP